MPKENISAFARRMMETFPNQLRIESDSTLICIPCKTPIPVSTLFQVKQHLRTGKHKRNCERNQMIAARNATETSLVFDGSTSGEVQFNQDFFRMLHSARVPISKSSHPKFAEFIEKHTPYSLPSEAALREACVTTMYAQIISRMRHEASNKYIWVSLDETTDANQRNIVNFVFGFMKMPSEKASTKSFLLNVAEMNIVNEDTIVEFFTDSLRLIWPKGLNTDKLLLVTTAATPYMCDAMIKLSEIFPKMIHVNCVARDLQHISELVRLRAADVEALICRVASVFDKSPLFRHEFRELYANIPLPPTSTQFTQWSTWIEAAIYYTQYFAEIIAALSRFSESDTAVREAHDAFLAHTVKQTLAFIGFNFHSFADAIKEIQKRGIPLARSIQHIDEVYVPLDAMNHPFFRDEFDKLMERNPGFEKLKSINCILNGRPCDDDHIERYTPVELLKYALAPITMCNVEHSFSAYKSVLLERDVPPNQLREHLVVYCNDF